LLNSLKGSTVLEDLNSLHSQGIDMVEPAELTSHIKGRANMINQLESMMRNASTIDMITTESAFAKKADVIKKVHKKEKRNLNIRIITSPSKKSKAVAEQLKDIAEVRYSPDVSARITLADGKKATIMLVPHKKTHPDFDTGLSVNSPFFTSALQSFFEQTWNNSSK